MKYATQIDGLVDTLGAFGLRLSPDAALEMLGWVGLLLSGGVAGFFLIMKVKAEKRTYSISDLLSRLDKQDSDIRDLKRDMEELRTENRELRNDNRDHEETLKDFAGHILSIDQWMVEGGKPPAPAKSWRIREFMGRYIADH